MPNNDFATRLESLMERATELPWCAESCGEKGDGSNLIGVAFHPDDIDAEHPLSGWLQEWDDAGNEIDYYRDEEVAELSHRTRNAGENANLILFLANHAPAIARLVRAAEKVTVNALDGEPYTPDAEQALRAALNELNKEV